MRNELGAGIWMVMTFFLFLSPLSCLAGETVIRGGKMEILEKGESILFTNGVRLEKGSDTLTSNRMVTDKNRDKIHAAGEVKLTRKLENGEEWKGFGSEGFYDTQSGVGYLLGKGKQAHLIYFRVLSATSTQRIDIFADRVDFTRPGQMGLAKGNVYGKTTDPGSGELYEFWSQTAEYDRQKGTIVLTGEPQPLVTQKKGEDHRRIQGDVVTYFIDSQKFKAEGHSKAVFSDSVEKRK